MGKFHPLVPLIHERLHVGKDNKVARTGKVKGRETVLISPAAEYRASIIVLHV